MRAYIVSGRVRVNVGTYYARDVQRIVRARFRVGPTKSTTMRVFVTRPHNTYARPLSSCSRFAGSEFRAGRSSRLQVYYYFSLLIYKARAHL